MTWYSDWPYRNQITISGQMISGNLTNFPFRFILSGNSYISSNAHSGGKDFIFTTDDGVTRIHCERDGYLYGSGSFWVRAPSLTNQTPSTFYLYYGKKEEDHSNDTGYKPSGVWDNKFKAVFHLNEPSGTITNSVTLTNSHASGTGSPLYLNSGQIGAGISFVTDSILTLDPVFTNEKDFTLEGWARPYTTGVYNFINQYASLSGAHLYGWGGGTLAVLINGVQSSDTLSYNVGTWNYVVGVNSTPLNKCRIYINCIRGASDGYTHKDPLWNRSRINLGNNWALSADWIGGIDEVRLSSGARSVGWIRTTYSSSKLPSKYIKLGDREDIPASITTTTFYTKSGTTTRWIWAPITINTGYAPRYSGSVTNWTWGIVSGSSHYYIPSGNETRWSWISETT